MVDITAWNARSFDALTRSNQLFLSASELHRDDLSQDATAAAAMLVGGYVALPTGHASQITATYKILSREDGPFRAVTPRQHLSLKPTQTVVRERRSMKGP